MKFSRKKIKNLAVELQILEQLGFNLPADKREIALEELADYVLRLLDWQHPATILDEIFKDPDEVKAVRQMIIERLVKERNSESRRMNSMTNVKDIYTLIWEEVKDIKPVHQRLPSKKEVETKAGAWLDALVQEVVFGSEVVNGDLYYGEIGFVYVAENTTKPIPSYSTTMEWAMKVVDKMMTDYGMSFKPYTECREEGGDTKKVFFAVFTDRENKVYGYEGSTIPEAICRAAFLAALEKRKEDTKKFLDEQLKSEDRIELEERMKALVRELSDMCSDYHLSLAQWQDMNNFLLTCGVCSGLAQAIEKLRDALKECGVNVVLESNFAKVE